MALSHESLADSLVGIGARLSPAELQGMVTGSLAAGARFDVSSWQQELARWLDASTGSITGPFLELYDETLGALAGEELSYQPLMPDDDEALEERVTEMGAWCRGFLGGFGMAGRQSELSEQVKELLTDFVEISKVSDDVAHDEDTEVQLVELIEYLKVGALLVFTEYGQAENH